MARILYGICGIGMGHCMRSVPVLEELTKEHEVMVVSYGAAYKVLKGRFPKTRNVKYFEIFFNETTISKRKTILYNLPKLPSVVMANISGYTEMLRGFRPDIVVSDFEIGAFYLSRMLSIPAIVISNMHAMKYIKLAGEVRGAEYYLTERPQLDAFRGAEHYIVISLMKPEKKRRNVDFFYPVVDRAVLGKKPSNGGFVLVYSSPASRLWEIIEPVLKKFPKTKFTVYCGARESKISGNVAVKPREKEEFTEDLAKCSAVICSGGFSLISEATVLGKPVLAVTPKAWYERYYNGLMLRELGIGEVAESASGEALAAFLANCGKYRKNLSRAGIRAGNKEIIAKIKELIAEKCGGKKARGF